MQALLKRNSWHTAEWKVLGLQPTPELVAVSVGMRLQLQFYSSLLGTAASAAPQLTFSTHLTSGLVPVQHTLCRA